MALRGETGWQTEKTLVECMRYMFDNNLGADVIFEVGPPDGDNVYIRAQKFMLISRSEVFEAMFSSGMAECKSSMVRVEDIAADIFKDLLLYIYSDVVSVSVETAPSLVYAARKYMLPKLVRACCLHLSENLNVNNVIEVLEASVIIDDTELERKCLQLIVQEPRTVLTGTEILTASRQTMKIILQMDSITIEETVIYETCIAWAKHQLQTQNPAENHTTDQQIRDILGDFLYMIRFPIMQVTEFAEITEIQTILTPEEKMSIFYFLTTKMKDFQLMFPTEPRRFGEEYWIERAVTSVAAELRSGPVRHAINFTADKDILLTGIGLYTGYKDYGYAVDVEILQSTESLFRRKLRVPYTKDANQFKVSVTEPLPLKAGVLYSVTAWCHGSIGHHGETCQEVCTKGKVTFTFSRDQRSVYTTPTPTVGQIPRLYFRY